MKIDRLLGITIYLLNHGLVNANQLAQRFEVSKRTIQRDIEALCLAGIPVISILGADGGYEITKSFKLSNQLMNDNDYTNIVTALKGLYSANNNKNTASTLDKLLAHTDKNGRQKIQLDFGVLRESDKISEYISTLESAISNDMTVYIEYNDSSNNVTKRQVEPLLLTYKWYAWYLFGFCKNKNDYRLFKLVRIKSITTTSLPFIMKHADVDGLLEKCISSDSFGYLDITLFCKSETRVLAMEYLGGRIITEYDNGDFLLQMHVIESERLWFSLLLSFGDQVKVIEPSKLVEKIKHTAEGIYNVYKDVNTVSPLPK